MSVDNLTQWTILYVKNKDILKKEIKEYKIFKNYVEFEYLDARKQTCYIYPTMKSEARSDTKEGWKAVICLNTKANFDFLISNWENLIKNPKLSIIFVNPRLNQKWIVFPHTHNKITEKASLKLGLQTLFESVARV
ncbi:hypothetical protein GOV08_01240 [Candidatus Woesearchaeota archaeon]|nr:hypothetical protein [Candidatus Woesearchaeota archaeon]